MPYLFLTVATIGVTMQTVIYKEFNIKCGIGIYMFNSICSFAGMLVFLIASIIKGTFVFSTSTIIYSLLFAGIYTTYISASTLMYKYGPFAISALTNSYALLIPTFYGVIFENAKITSVMLFGIALLAISIFMINYKKDTGNDGKKVNTLWVVITAIVFISGGMAPVLQRIEQNNVVPKYNDTFMICALFISGVASLIISLFHETNEQRKLVINKSFLLAVLLGAANGIVNILVMWLNIRKFPTAVMFPVISAGGMIIIFVISYVYYKEKFSKIQACGFLLGISSIILLNI